jgi:hypothetical protein
MLSSCKWSDAHLGDNYYYLNKYEAIDSGYPDGAIIYKSQQENVFQNVMVNGNVVKVNFNDQFILAKQSPLKHPTDTVYFIILKKLDKVYGPLKADSFINMKKVFRISLKL